MSNLPPPQPASMNERSTLIPSTRDLTGLVQKVQEYCFDCGGSADVWMGIYKGNEIVAVKVLKGPLDPMICRRLDREIRVWDQLRHPNIIPFYGISTDFACPGIPCLVSPYYAHGDINKYLMVNAHVDRLPFVVHIIRALYYLHSRGVIHGDLKGKNVLINDQGEAVLCDFGLSRIIGTSGFTTRTVSGTFRFQAPELLMSESEIIRVTAEADVYAFAMTVLEILTGKLPFSDIERVGRVIYLVISGARPKRMACPEIPNDIWGVLEACWDREWSGRPSAVSLLAFFEAKLSSLRESPLATLVEESNRIPTI